MPVAIILRTTKTQSLYRDAIISTIRERVDGGELAFVTEDEEEEETHGKKVEKAKAGGEAKKGGDDMSAL